MLVAVLRKVYVHTQQAQRVLLLLGRREDVGLRENVVWWRLTFRGLLSKVGCE